MPTDVTKTIGTGGDYSTIAAWIAAIPSDLVAADQRWIGQLKNQTFTEANIIGGSRNTDATRYIILECVSGSSFSDNAGVRTNALLYNASNGAAVTAAGSSGYVIEVTDEYTQLIGLQLNATSYATALFMQVGHGTVSQCIITGANAGGYTVFDNQVSGGTVFENCLIHKTTSSFNAVRIVGSGAWYNCTIVNPGGTPGTSIAIHLDYNAAIFKNCAVFGFGSFTDSTTAAGSDYNATDNSSASTGTHNQTSLTYSAQFHSTTNDFRAASLSVGTGIHNGTPDSTHAANDISGFARDATNPYIGAWESSAAGPSTTITEQDLPSSHSGNITVHAVGSSTSYVNGTTTFTASGVTGWAVVSTTVVDSTHATVVLSCPGTATYPNNNIGTLTLTEGGTGSTTGTTGIHIPTIAVSPVGGNLSSSVSVTFTGTHTLWATDTPVITATGVSGTSVGSFGTYSNTSVTATITTSTTPGDATITDPSTGATTTFGVGGTLAVTAPVQYQTYQRNGSNQAGIPITGSWTGGPSGSQAIEASFNGGAYATIATVTAGPGTSGPFSGTLTAQVAGQGTLTVRFATQTSVVTTVSTVGIGDVFIVAGQSNAVGEIGTQQSYTSSGGLIATCFNGQTTSGALYNTGAWQQANDPFYVGNAFGSHWPLLATLYLADQGLPCAFIETPVGGKPLTNDGGLAPWYFTKYRPDTGAAGVGYSFITTQMTRAATGGAKAALWYQGENDQDGGVPEEEYAAALVTFADNVARDVTDAPPTIPIQIGGCSANVMPIPIDLAIVEAVKLGGNLLGTPAIWDVTNLLHIPNATVAQTVANRYWAVLKSEFFGGTSGNGHGPRLVAIQYDATRTKITVTFDKVLKSGLSFSASAWGVTGNGVGATINSVTYATDTSSVVLTLAAAASTPILVSFPGTNTPAGLVVPLGPDFTLPGATGTINLPAEPFASMQAAPATGSSGTGPVGQVVGARSIGTY